jgi:hypothetical protein
MGEDHHRFERMRLRGFSGARDEFHLAAIVQNLKILANIPGVRPKNTGRIVCKSDRPSVGRLVSVVAALQKGQGYKRDVLLPDSISVPLPISVRAPRPESVPERLLSAIALARDSPLTPARSVVPFAKMKAPVPSALLDPRGSRN